MVKDSKKFADSGGWGYAQFDYDSASKTFKPGDENSTPPQEHDAKCGFACHTIVADKDYVFTAYPKAVKTPLLQRATPDASGGRAEKWRRNRLDAALRRADRAGPGDLAWSAR